MSGAFDPIAFDEYAFDVDYSASAALFASVAGVARANGRSSTDFKVMQDLTITEVVDDTPNRARFTAMGFTPTTGQRVVIALGGITNPERLFAGNVISTDQGYLGQDPDNQANGVNCISDTWRLNRRRVWAEFTGTATDIVTELMATYAPEFTLDNVVADLPLLDGGISFTDKGLATCLTEIAKRIGGYWYLDYLGDLHFFLTESGDDPDDLTDAANNFWDFSISRDFSQTVTRVNVVGGGANALTDVAIGETIIPLEDAPDTWYGDVSGVVVIKSQRVSFGGRVAGGGGSLVGPGVGPSSAPMAALAAGAGVTDGDHEIAIVFITSGTNHSLLGPRTTISVGHVAAPTVAPTASTPTYGNGPDPGAHYYAMTNVTAAGETTASTVSGTVTTGSGVTDPASAATNAVGPTTGFGSLSVGNSYSYKYTYADASGNESLPSSASNTVTVTASQRLALTGVAYTTDARIVKILFYRSANGGGGPWTRVAMSGTGADSNTYPNGVTNYTGGGTFGVDDIRWTLDGAGASAPTVNSTGTRTVPLTGLQVPASSLVTARKLYGTSAGGSQLKLIATLNTTDTSYSVVTPDASLGADAPSSNSATANQVALSGIALGSSTVTKREVYMGLANVTGGTLHLAYTINDNSTTDGITLTSSDATLSGTAAAPSSDTSGLAQPAGQVLRGSTSLLLAGTGEFRDAGGWAVLGNGQMVIRYTGISAGSLTGIPASGPGSITETVAYSTNVTAAPCLVGIPTGSPDNGSIIYPIQKGQPVNIFVQVDDLSAQSVVGGLLVDEDGNPTDGIIEDTLSDERVSRAESYAKGLAYLALRSMVEASIEYTCRDTKSRAGRTITVNLNAPTSVDDTFKIQDVEISFPVISDREGPFYRVKASTNRYSFESLLRQGGG